MEREELIEKYGIEIERLEQEQKKLAKQIELKDAFDFTQVEKFAAFDNSFIGNKILSSIICMNKNFEKIDSNYIFEKTNFPYISGFRAYRELPAMVKCFERLNESPDVVFISGQGISHPRLGLASHFGIITGIPTIGISDSAADCEVQGENLIKEGKIIGKVLTTKIGSRPIYITPGHKISIKSAFEITKKLIQAPHKLPEPLHIAGKYNNEVRKELEIK